MSEPRIFPLGEPVKNLTATVLGGKGLQLAELAALRYPVPAGFVITARCFTEQMDQNSELVSGVNETLASLSNTSDPEELEYASKVLRELIEQIHIDRPLSEEIRTEFKKLNAKRVAVRSSATLEDGEQQSFAGQFDTILNVSQDALSNAIVRCWSSAYTARSLAYRLSHSDSLAGVGFAVVVQELIDAKVSGVCFTKHPVSGDANQLVIDAVWGLGESVVAGEVSPDSYTVDKNSLSVVEQSVAGQKTMRIADPAQPTGSSVVEVPSSLDEHEKLNNQLLLDLAKLATDLERTFETHCDIEWALSDQLHLLQCRPVTT